MAKPQKNEAPQYANEFCKLINEARYASGVSFDTLADKCHSSPATLQHIFAGRQACSIRLAKNISRALKLDNEKTKLAYLAAQGW